MDIALNNNFLEYFGCSSKVFLNHLRDNLGYCMNFDNYGIIWNLDHENPLGLQKNQVINIALIKAITYYTNITPMLV